MNIWLTKLGDTRFSKQEVLEVKKFVFDKFSNTNISESACFEYKNKGVHYLSFDLSNGESKKAFNYADSENNLTAFSGLLVSTSSTTTDFRKAESIHNHSNNPSYISSNVSGNFAVLRAEESKFQCFVDHLGVHKVFYFKDAGGQIYVSNFIQLIKLFKKPDTNVPALLDWVIFESILHQETEEKNVFTLPEYGILKWDQKKGGLVIDHYKNLTSILYKNSTSDELLNDAVSSMKASATYLTNYHNPTFTLSGGYDSRLILNSFWNLDTSGMQAYTYADNYYDVKKAKKVAKDFGISHSVLEFSENIPTLQEIHDYLVSTNFPFFKYSDVFRYLVKKSLNSSYHNDLNGVLIKGTMGNTDRRIIELSYLDKYEGTEAISIFLKNKMEKVESNFFNKEYLKFLHGRIESYYKKKYLPFVSGRGKDHKLKYFLHWENHKKTDERIGGENASFFNDIYWPLATESLLTLIYNSDETVLHRGHKESIYHQLNRAFTNGEDKPIHFSNGLHWEANKLSRAFTRLKRNKIEKKLQKIFNFKDKTTSQIKDEFYRENKDKALKILEGVNNSVLWDYLDRDYVIKQYRGSSNYDNANIQFIFKHLLPILILDKDGLL